MTITFVKRNLTRELHITTWDIWALNYRKGIKTECKPFQLSRSTVNSEDRSQTSAGRGRMSRLYLTPDLHSRLCSGSDFSSGYRLHAPVRSLPHGFPRTDIHLTAPSTLPFGPSPYDKSSFCSGKSAPPPPSDTHGDRRAAVPLRKPRARGWAVAPQGDPPPERPLGFARHSDLTNQRTAYGRPRGIPPIRYPLLEAASKRHRGSATPWRPALPVTLMAALTALGEARQASGFPAGTARCDWWVQAERRGFVPPWREFGRARTPSIGIPSSATALPEGLRKPSLPPCLPPPPFRVEGSRAAPFTSAEGYLATYEGDERKRSKQIAESSDTWYL